MSADDLPPAVTPGCTAPFYRTEEGRIELVVPRAGGASEVYPVPLAVALVHLEDLAAAIRRQVGRPIITMGREPA